MLLRFCLYGFLKNQRYFEPFLILIFLQQGLSFFLIGLLIAVKELTVNLLEIPSGAIADSTGRRGAMMLSFIAYIISFVIFGICGSMTPAPWWPLIPAMVLYGVGDSFRTGTHKAMIFEWLRIHGRTDEKTKVYGLTRSWSQIGSAVSGIIAALFVFLSDDYRYVFWFAILPYLANLINFAGYPAELDGEHAKSSSPAFIYRRLLGTFGSVFRIRKLRVLMLETMGWEGYLAAIEGFLQPVLQVLAIGVFAFWLGDFVDPETLGEINSSPSEETAWFSKTRQSATLIGIVYSAIFFLSAVASRKADSIQRWLGKSVDGDYATENTGNDASGSNEVSKRQSNSTISDRASNRLWLINAGLFTTLAIASWFSMTLVVVLTFVALTTLKNVWRPILIGRFDDLSSAEDGATMLSIESQARHGATLIFAPLLGWVVDMSSGQLWPLGLTGMLLAAIAIAMNKPKQA